jgi:hypothetical protein
MTPEQMRAQAIERAHKAYWALFHETGCVAPKNMRAAIDAYENAMWQDACYLHFRPLLQFPEVK